MKKIIEGVRKFQKDVFPKHKSLFNALAKSQNPDVLFITCSDSRIDPCLITQTKPGELFISRNAGNIVPIYKPLKSGGITASLEYAVSALNVKHVVVCGHTSCGAMIGALNPGALTNLPHTKEWIEHSFDAVDRVKLRHECSCDEPLDEVYLPEVIEENVIQQLKHLVTHPCVQERMAAGLLEIHGWVYDIETGVVKSLDQETNTFDNLIELED